MNNWNAIRRFYSVVTKEILDTPSNEWAIDPYAWDMGTGMIEMTPIESWLWHDIRAADLVLYPQFPIAGFFVDFANPRAKVAIECDGAEFHRDVEKDAARDKTLIDAGWCVYRISGQDCRNGVGSDEEWKSRSRDFLFGIVGRHNIKVGAHA